MWWMWNLNTYLRIKKHNTNLVTIMRMCYLTLTSYIVYTLKSNNSLIKLILRIRADAFNISVISSCDPINIPSDWMSRGLSRLIGKGQSFCRKVLSYISFNKLPVLDKYDVVGRKLFCMSGEKYDDFHLFQNDIFQW